MADPRALLSSDILYVHTAHGIPQWVTWYALVHVVLGTEESEMGKPNCLLPEIPVVNGGGGRRLIMKQTGVKFLSGGRYGEIVRTCCQNKEILERSLQDES